MDNEMFEFAVVVDVEPDSRENEWLQAIRTAAAKRTAGMNVTVRHASLVMMCVEDQMEFAAIDKAMAYLNSVAASVKPPITVRLNAQPANEV